MGGVWRHLTQIGEGPVAAGLFFVCRRWRVPLTDECQSSNDKGGYDLEERTALFGEAVIELAGSLPKDPVNSPVISQGREDYSFPPRHRRENEDPDRVGRI